MPGFDSPSPLSSPIEGEEKAEVHRGCKLSGGEVSVTNARQLRKRLTDAERKLWHVLRNKGFNGHKFRRQEPIGKCIVDFICYEEQLVIELDGGQHVEQVEYDKDRSEWLAGQGYKVLRFWNHEVVNNFEAVQEVIWKNLR